VKVVCNKVFGMCVGFTGNLICGLRKQSSFSLDIISSRQLDLEVSDEKFKII